jgi:hypothetical protein
MLNGHRNLNYCNPNFYMASFLAKIIYKIPNKLKVIQIKFKYLNNRMFL